MNFEYLKSVGKLKKLYEYCVDAEDFAVFKPSISATSSRKALEYVVKFIYETSIPGAELYKTIYEIMTDPSFIYYVHNADLLNSMHFIRKMGNAAAHDGNLEADEAILVLKELCVVVGEFSKYLGIIDEYPQFVEPGVVVNTTKTPEAAAKKEKIDPDEELIAEFAARMRDVKFDTTFMRDESENKKMFLQASFREAGWPIAKRPNQAIPSSASINMLLDDGDVIDYVLYGRNNHPLAIVEHVKGDVSILEGRLNGIAKANKLEKKYGYKPVVYYTNGYSIFVVDQLGYNPRRVFQLHTIDELELLIDRATSRKDISNPVINENITNRYYQKDAIKSVCAAFSDKRRHSLLVMATGTGKTRVSISTVEVLMKNNWVKNVLFLADRTSLVRQAHKNFNKLLPSTPTSIYSGDGSYRDPNARIIFSTYQTMINLINDDTREFSIGRFDLIIIDEAHRSIFRKYSALFYYFDALMLGLTATPRAEENKSTYEMFEMNDGCPDYAYELLDAIDDKYLVGFSVFDRTTDKLRNGVCYDDLSEEEKKEFEESFDLDSSRSWSGLFIKDSLFQEGRIINTGTIDVMLNDLMKNGLKVNGGDKIGKTIIFASTHEEAMVIADRFNKLYSYLDPGFCKVIDSQIPEHLNLIDTFGERDNMPQIAVSVDMMDTGIDVPDVINLVFFKKIKSKIKFLQMVGRGTRLCPDVFGPGDDKKGFFIFDYYDNFRFFRAANTWSTVDGVDDGTFPTITPQSVLINTNKLKILRVLIEKSYKTTFEINYMNELKEFFITSTNMLCNDDIEVQYKMAWVNKYRTPEIWNGFTNAKQAEIEKYIIPLFPTLPDLVKVKNFDLMMYVIEAEVIPRMLEEKDIRKIRFGFGNVGNKINAMIEEVLKLKTIPEVIKHEELLLKMKNCDYIFDDFSIERCEYVRNELRGLMQYIKDDKPVLVIDVDDSLFTDSNPNGTSVKKTYSQKVAEFVQSNSTELAKLRNLDPLTDQDKTALEEMMKTTLGTESDYASISNNLSVPVFLRIQVGISDEAIKTKFGSFLNTDYLNEQQHTYMTQIVKYAKENGDITFIDLQRVSPFCDIDITELFGDKILDIKTLINGIHRPIM